MPMGTATAPPSGMVLRHPTVEIPAAPGRRTATADKITKILRNTTPQVSKNSPAGTDSRPRTLGNAALLPKSAALFRNSAAESLNSAADFLDSAAESRESAGNVPSTSAQRAPDSPPRTVANASMSAFYTDWETVKGRKQNAKKSQNTKSFHPRSYTIAPKFPFCRIVQGFAPTAFRDIAIKAVTLRAKWDDHAPFRRVFPHIPILYI